MASEKVLHAESNLKAAVSSLPERSRASNLRSGKKLLEKRPAMDAGRTRC